MEKQRPYDKKMDLPCSTCVRDRKGCQRGWFYARNDGKWTCDHKVESGDVSPGLTPELRKKIVRKIVEEYQETRDPFLRSPKGFERFLKQRWDHYEWKECWAVVACTHCGITVRLFDTKPAVECPRCGRLIVLGDPLTETTPLGRIG